MKKNMKIDASLDEVRKYIFGDFIFDVFEQQLTDMDENAIQLSSRLRDVLLYMLERPGKLLRKKVLLNDIWLNVVVEENSINQAVAALRKVLGDSATKSQYIQTVPKEGFRFVMPIIASSDNKPIPQRFNMNQKIEYCQTNDGVTLAYSVLGEGHPLILLPTWLSHLEAQFENPIFHNYIMEFSSHYKLIRFDLRGFGMSDRKVPPVTFDDYITDIETIVEHLDLDRVALLGPSGGALIGSAYAARHPEKVSHLVCLSGFTRGARTTGDSAGIAHADVIEAVIRTGWGKSKSSFSEWFCSILLPNGSKEQFDRLDQDQLMASDGENAEHFFKIISLVDLTEELKEMDVATLICHGMLDRGVPFSEGEYANKIIPNSKLISLPTKNHILLYDEPAWEIFIKALHEFILD